MSLTGAMVASQIKNPAKIVLYIIGFFIFVISLIVIGIAGWKNAAAFVVGFYVLAVTGYLVIRGKIDIRWGIAMMLFGAVLVIWNPAGGFTIGELFRGLGMEPEKIASVVPKNISKIIGGL